MHWRYGLLIVVLAVIFGWQSISLSQSGTGAADINLSVNEWSNISRVNEPVTAGIPIAPDQTSMSWSLFDGPTEIPLQTTILPGLKTPWLLLDFQTSVNASQAKTLTLKSQAPAATPAQPLVVNEDSSQITVTTGTFRTQLSKTNFNLLDTVWIDTNADGIFSDGERLLTPAAGSNLPVHNAGDGLDYSGQGAPRAVTWEYQGPLRATLRVDGAYANGPSTALDFTTRLTWYAGQTHIKIEHLIRNSSSTHERYVKLRSAKLNVGAPSTTNRIIRSGDIIWTNVMTGAAVSLELIPATLDVSTDYAPYATPVVPRQNQLVNIDSDGIGSGGLIIGDLSYHGATAHVDFTPGLSAAEKARRATAAKDPLVALAPQNWYSELGAFGSDRFGTYDDEKDAYAKWGWTWPTPGNPWSYEHDRPRVQDIYPSWSVLDTTNDPESDDLWQNIVMFGRVRIPFFLDRFRAWARYWKWEWTFRTDTFTYAGGWGSFWDGPGAVNRPTVQPTLHENDSDYINHNIKHGKAGTSHMWNGGLLDYYYLTGDRDALEAAIDTAEMCRRFFEWQVPGSQNAVAGGRFAARCFLILTLTWEATGDSQWQTAMEHLADIFLQAPRYDRRGFYYDDLCENPASEFCQRFPNGKLIMFLVPPEIQALYRYYLVTNEAAARTRLIQMAEFGRDFGVDPDIGFGGDYIVVDSPTAGSVLHLSYDQFRSPNPTNLVSYAESSSRYINALVIGYRLTGDPSYLDRAKFYWNQASKGNYGSRYATDTQVGAFANSLQAWSPYSLLFPEGGDWTDMNLLFYDSARHDTVPPSAVTDLMAP